MQSQFLCPSKKMKNSHKRMVETTTSLRSSVGASCAALLGIDGFLQAQLIRLKTLLIYEGRNNGNQETL